MDRVRNLLEQIQGRLDELNKAERKVAEVILLNPQQATRFSIAALAQAAKVSEPTVNRFCRSFGVSGYPELKLQLAQSLASGAAYVSRAVEADDDPAAYTQKIFASAIASLDGACQQLDPAQVSRAVDMMIQARQIHFFGLGASAPVALDAQHKFFRFNLAVSAHADVLGSDHAPHTLEEKRKAYPDSPSGMTGVQTLVPVMLDHVAAGRLSLQRFVDLTSAGPKRIFGIARKGRLAVGYDADVTVVDLKRRETITNAWIASKCGWTPHDGRQVTGWPVGTVVRGQAVMWEGALTEPSRGEAVRFEEGFPARG